MRSLTLATVCMLALTYGSVSVQSDDGPPDDCVAIAAQVEVESHVKFIRKSHSALFFDPRLPVYSAFDNDLSVQCGTGVPEKQYYNVSLHWSQGSVPPKAYYELAGKAGAVLTGEKSGVLSEASELQVARNGCRRKAHSQAWRGRGRA
jgi:hypothetical protein